MRNAPSSDALAFFGATGDLAYKKIFPALHAMARRGHLEFPVIGVAKSGWNLDQLRARARESIEKHGGGVNDEAFRRLIAHLRYIDGDYQDPATYAALLKAMDGAQYPAHYLAIPPSLFAIVIENLGRSGCTRNGVVSASATCCCLPTLAWRRMFIPSAYAAISPYSIPLWTILTKWPAPLGPQWR